MEMQRFPLKSVLRKVLLATAALGALALAGAPRASANDGYDCQRRIDRAEWKLEEAIERHGYYSRQANHERHELREERERCLREQRRWRDQEWRRRRNHDRDYDENRGRRYYNNDDGYYEERD
ncbi:MAG: hypothetical protein PVS2B2_20220 [Candidatus Acidiferrum sp.]